MQRCFVLILVKYSQHFLPEICIALEAVLLKLHTELALGWALIRVNFDPIQENWAKTKGWMLFCPFSRDYGTSVLFHMVSPALVFTCLPPLLAATTSGVS